MAQAGNQPPSDAQLVADLRAGDVAALEVLYRRHAATVARVVTGANADREVAADLVQECFARVLERIHTLADPERFRAWLLAIARNTAVDAGRRRVRQRTDVLDEEVADVASSSTGPEELAELNELGRLVDGAVAGLSPRDATALTLVTRFGLAPDEIAVAMGMNATAARVALHRARRRLKDALRLQLLVRGRRGCSALQRCLSEDALTAARHVRSCTRCAEEADDEISFYEHQDSVEDVPSER